MPNRKGGDVVVVETDKKLTNCGAARSFKKRKLSCTRDVLATTKGQVECGRFVPYGPQLNRIARAVGFPGCPAERRAPLNVAEGIGK